VKNEDQISYQDQAFILFAYLKELPPMNVKELMAAMLGKIPQIKWIINRKF